MIETKGLTGGEALLRVLAGMGVDRIFASPGSEWSPVWEALARPDPRSESIPLYLSARHEETAVSMASGYVKASGKLPAVMIHTTVGALHASMALRGAYHEQIPMVVFCGESVGFGEEEGPDPGGQWLRHLTDMGGPARLVERCVKWSFGVNSKALVPMTIQRACQLAMASPQGPVFVSLPMEFLFDKMTTDPLPAAAFPLQATAGSAGIEELAKLLAGAKNPIIITEEAGRTEATVKRLVEIAELLGAAVIETRSTTFGNFPRTHPLHGGFEPREYLQEADMVLILGAVAPWHPASAGPGPGVKVAILDENPVRDEVPFWGYQADLCLKGEVEGSVSQLLEKLKQQVSSNDSTRTGRRERWHKRFRERKESWKQEAVSFKDHKPIDTRWAIYELSQVLPPNVMVVEETITHRLAIHRYLDALRPGSYFAGCTGGLGTGLGTALGVKAAAPKRPVVAIMGDGAFNYNPALATLGFSQEYGMPILIILMNNRGYKSMKAGVPRYYPEGWAVRTKTFVGTSITPSPDYAAITRAYGGFGEKVEEPGEVRRVLERGFKAVAGGQVALIDIWLDAVN
ncbi:MAG: thiamine pyrophosphate-dependent enzyme [Candidatus Binatia bacterium]